MTMKRVTVPVVVAADGTATVYSAPTRGKIHSVAYQKTDFADGVDFTITVDRTAEGIWTESNVNAATIRYPRAPTHDQVGAARLYAAGGVAVADKIALSSDHIKIAIAQGGVSKSGAFVFMIED